jgi:hypothetical protein
MPVHIQGQAGWQRGERDNRYYDPGPLGGTGGGGVRWNTWVFYESYHAFPFNPWTGVEMELAFPSLADQFNNAIRRHLHETPTSVNAWGFNHHVVNVMRADLTGLSDNWNVEIAFLLDIADGKADGVIEPPRPDLVQFVTMQELHAIFESR